MIKKISLLIIIFCFFINLFTVSFGVDAIDWNVTNNTTTNSANTSIQNQSTTTNSAQNTNTNASTSTNVNSVNPVTDSQAALTNILNIVLIVIGILLVLLSIAILIRLKH